MTVLTQAASFLAQPAREPAPVTVGASRGLLHAAPGAVGVVVLNSFGFESLAAHHSLRLLADDLAARGFPTLRIDFPGTGDSLGDESAFEAVSSRRDAAIAAARWMREESGVDEVVFVGFRLGGSIAAIAARDAGVSRMALLAPAPRGRAFLRELQHLFRLGGVEQSSNAGALEFQGLALSSSTVSALGALDLAKLNSPADKVLVLASDGHAALRNMIETWRAGGVDVEQREFEGLATLLVDPTDARPPRTDFAAVIDWLGDPRTRAHARMPVAKPVIEDTGFIEEVVRCGAEPSVFGILCAPREKTLRAPVLFINTGGNPHIGWGRQTVEFARKLAHEGVASLRIDVAGIGETLAAPGRPERIVYVADAARDVIEAANFLRGRGYADPILFGVCSGAHLAFQTLRVDRRFSGAMLANLQKFFWNEGDSRVLYRSVASYASMWRDADMWRRLLRGEVDLRGVARMVRQRLARKIALRFAALRTSDQDADGKTAKLAQPVLARVLEEGIPINVVYSDDDGGIDEFEAQLGRRGRALQGYANFSFALIQGAEHNFTFAADRQKLYGHIAAFAHRCASRNG